MLVDGFFWLATAIGVAGIVRGFTGFGTALIFVPVAGRFLAPADLITVMAMTGIVSTAAILPRAWRAGDRRDVGILILSAVPIVPVGLWTMSLLPIETVRWCVAVAAAVTLASLLTGIRYEGRLGLAGLICVGMGAGFLGGLTGLTGPIVILAYLASRATAEVVRANTILFLAGLDVVLLANLLLGGLAQVTMLPVALMLAVPYLVTTLIGQALFDPKSERVYRGAAYAVIALAVITGLPLWDN